MNRGRIQAQGYNLEESEPWAQIEDINKLQGIQYTASLKGKLNAQQIALRLPGFNKLERFIYECPNTGADAQVIKSFYDKSDRIARVDLEIRAGRAFVDQID